MKARQEAPLAPPAARKLRCAVYTRKSSEEGLDQAFNSLDAQREACEAYVLSQRAEGWLLVPNRYDDGGVSGGTLERPALRRLLVDIETGKVDVVVVYKIDRLSRALMDFAKLVEVFDRHQVTFVSVTQAFNTTTSMGRLTLNVLLSFAQFEREVIGERIRDKFAASRRRGMWMGGNVPFGYVVGDRKLVIHKEQATTVRMIFERFARVGSATTLAGALAREGVLTPRGKPIDKGWIYKLLTNRLYVGEAVHKGTAYPGEHQAIVTRTLWDKVHAILQESPRKRAADTRTSTPALLKGLIFGPTGCAMSPTYTRKSGRLYRYYVSQAVLKQGRDGCPVGRLPAAEIETAVIDQVRGLLRAPEIVVGTWRASKTKTDDGMSEDKVRQALQDLDPLWDELFPAEQARIIQLLVERIDIGTQGFDLRLRIDGLADLARDLASGAASLPGGSMSTPAQTLTVRVPFTIRKRGGRKLAIAADGTALAPPRPRIDSTLVKALARAHRWNKLLEKGRYASAAQLAAAEKINPSYVSRVLRLTLLAPDIVEAIVEGRQADVVEAHCILKPFSAVWAVYVRRSGDLLHPAREPREVLERVRRSQGSLTFQAQYQQDPVPPGGNIIHRDWLRYYRDVDWPEQFDRVVASWDTATTLGDASDYSVGTVWGALGLDYYLLDVVRARLEAPDLRRRIVELDRHWSADATVIENTELGRALLADLRRTGTLQPLLIRPRFDKEARLLSQSARFQAGQVYLPAEASWLGEYVGELLAFPNGRHDDQVDSTSQALHYLTARSPLDRPLVRRNIKRRSIARAV